MGGKASKKKEEETEEKRGQMRRSLGREDSLTSTERIRRYAIKQFGYNVLSLARRGLKDVPEELWELLELEKLNLSLNSLKVLPPQLALLSNLVVLNLWGNQLTSLPAEIGQLRRLRVLFAYRNRLTDVPEELGACTQLEVLSLANNQLSSLPSSLSNLSSLKKLNLSHNHITHVPGCVYNMKTLVFLHLAYNRLENLAENIQALVELKILIVEGNNLHCLPKALCCLTRLELLNLDFNDIKDVPQEMHLLSRLEKLACHPLDKGLHIVHNPLLKPVKEVLEGGLTALYCYLKAGVKPGPIEKMAVMSAKPKQRTMAKGVWSTLYKAISGELLDLSVLRVSEIYKEFNPVSAPTICTMGITCEVPLVNSTLCLVQPLSTITAISGERSGMMPDSLELTVTDRAPIERRNKCQRTMWCHANHGLEG
ncbi:leucine-rich repeat-containing protein 30a [Diretmus argenteus]